MSAGVIKLAGPQCTCSIISCGRNYALAVACPMHISLHAYHVRVQHLSYSCLKTWLALQARSMVTLAPAANQNAADAEPRSGIGRFAWIETMVRCLRSPCLCDKQSVFRLGHAFGLLHLTLLFGSQRADPILGVTGMLSSAAACRPCCNTWHCMSQTGH